MPVGAAEDVFAHHLVEANRAIDLLLDSPSLRRRSGVEIRSKRIAGSVGVRRQLQELGPLQELVNL